jgi:hypothetical protein
VEEEARAEEASASRICRPPAGPVSPPVLAEGVKFDAGGNADPVVHLYSRLVLSVLLWLSQRDDASDLLCHHSLLQPLDGSHDAYDLCQTVSLRPESARFELWWGRNRRVVWVIRVPLPSPPQTTATPLLAFPSPNSPAPRTLNLLIPL